MSEYSFGFTTGAAFLQESLIIARLFHESKDWAQVRDNVLTQNQLQARTESTLKKIYGEISRRLKHLSVDELELLVSGSDREQMQIIWLAICRQYRFISDFASEVISEHCHRGRYQLLLDDYDAFFNAKAEWHKNLDSISNLTKGKARQIVFKMCRECGIINDQDEIVVQSLSRQLVDLIRKNDSTALKIFPGSGY